MAKQTKQQRTQCHFISNTHWDREWRFSMQRTRYMLVSLIDMLFDIFEKEPNYKSFHFDSQTLPIQDYLEIRPERKEILKKYIKEKKILVGPWFTLPDEFCVSGESLIRNLLRGHKIGQEFGYVSKTGYSPFSWGQISQMPQIYNGFGIKFTAFYRGINAVVAPNSEFIWEGADGSRLIASRLAARPRFNVWCIIQRPVYWNLDVEDRQVHWGNGHGPFRLVNSEYVNIDCQNTHSRFEYFEENIDKSANQAYDEQNGDWTTPHRFWSCSHDLSGVDIREVRMIADCAKALKNKADVFHSTFEAFQKGVCESISSDLPIVRGEMRHFATKGSTSQLMGWAASSRIDIKQDNFVSERAINSYAEPMAVFASFLGAPYPESFIDLAYNLLLQNHSHDCIGGCSSDIVHKDMLHRTRQVRQISICLIERAMMDIAGTIDLSEYSPNDIALVVFNPAPFKCTKVIAAVIEIPVELDRDSFTVLNKDRKELPVQFCNKVASFARTVFSPNDLPNKVYMASYDVRVEFNNIPPMGYRTFFVKPQTKHAPSLPETMLIGPQTMENEYVTVSINENGTLCVKDKKTKRVFDQLGYFRDSSEIGTPWTHETVSNETIFNTLNEKAEVVLIRDGKLETAFHVSINWPLPEGQTKDGKTRNDNLKLCKIVNTITLRRGQQWVDITTEFDNAVKDHYLQVSFPSQIKADKVAVQSQFDVVEREIARPDRSLYEEEPATEHPMNSFVDISDGQIGFALLNEGLKSYEAHEDPQRTISLTLLRCYAMRFLPAGEWVDYSHTEKDSQCLGRHTFHYAVMPHASDWQQGRLWQMAECFNLAFQTAQIGPTRHGDQPLTKSFLEIEPDTIHISAVKRSENNNGWVVRLFNPLDKILVVRIRLNGGFANPAATQSPVERVQAEFCLPKSKGERWSRIYTVTMEEIPEHDLGMDADGWVKFEISTKKIITVEFE